MTTRFDKSKFSLTGAATALLFALSCSPVLASNGFKTHCSEATEELPASEVAVLSLDIRLVDHGPIDAAADMKAPATEPTDEDLPSPALADATTTKSTDDAEEKIENDDKSITVSDPPGTALRLPGVSEKDQPRFRRQMNRSDI